MVVAFTLRGLAGMALLAQAGGRPGGQARTAEVVSWSLILIGGLIAAFVAVAWFRKWMRDDGGADDGGPALTLGDLRELRARGDMTDQEYEKARAKVLGQARAVAAGVADPLGDRARARADQALSSPAADPKAGPAVPTDNTGA